MSRSYPFEEEYKMPAPLYVYTFYDDQGDLYTRFTTTEPPQHDDYADYIETHGTVTLKGSFTELVRHELVVASLASQVGERDFIIARQHEKLVAGEKVIAELRELCSLIKLRMPQISEAMIHALDEYETVAKP